MNDQGYYLADLSGNDVPPPRRQPFQHKILGKSKPRKEILSDKYKLAGPLSEIGIDPSTLWSPDEKKFVYKKKNEKGDSWQYYVRNLSDPLGVGERDEYLIATVSLDSKTEFGWYPDSKHLITSECDSGKLPCVSGSIHLVEIDGTNNTQIYSGSMSLGNVFPTPDGSKIIILATFNQSAPPNLYAISLR